MDNLIEILKELKTTENKLTIGEKLDQTFDGPLKEIYSNWKLEKQLTDKENTFLDLYSELQLSIVEYFYLKYNPRDDNDDLIRVIRRSLFQVKRISILKDAILFISEEQQSKGRHTEVDRMFLYLTRMIDARTLAYRLCYKQLDPPPHELNEALLSCLLHHDSKSYLYDTNDFSRHKSDKSILDLLTYRHQFFIGCCTFAVALFEKNQDLFKDDTYKKYIYLLAKYVRVVLNDPNFTDNQISLCCLRGILAILTNLVPTAQWISIVNAGLMENSNEASQRANPFNHNLFYLILSKLLANKTLTEKAVQSQSCLETSLIDIALVFINKWSDTLTDLNQDDEEVPELNPTLDSNREINQVGLILRSKLLIKDEELTVSKLLTPFIHAQFDRLRLMAMATLSNLMTLEDFKALSNDQNQMAKDLVELVFDFIDQAVKQQSQQYKGISFDRLLRYLFRFLIQDFIKEQTVVHVSKIVTFARQYHLFALKILRRLSSDPNLREPLLKNEDFKKFMHDEGPILFDSNPKMKNILDKMQQSFIEQTGKSEQDNKKDRNMSDQALISYAHRDSAHCDEFAKRLRNEQVFSNIWIDKENSQGNIVETVADAIVRSSVVFLLLSESYCASEFCRDQWFFAKRKGKTIYPIVISKSFKIDSYDWVSMSIGNTSYYQLYEPKSITELIEVLRKPKGTVKSSISKVEKLKLPLLTKSSRRASLKYGRTRSFTHKPVYQWTQEDVRDWCIARKLDKWNAFLSNYDGSALLELAKMLGKESTINAVIKRDEISIFDIPVLKTELQRAIRKY